MAHPSLRLSTSGLMARIIPDEMNQGSYILCLGSAEQSHVNMLSPETIFYEYLRRIGNVIDALAVAGEPLRIAHLGAGALTLVRYVQATRPGSIQVAVDIERELVEFVTAHLPLPLGTQCQSVVADAREVLGDIPRLLDSPAGADAMVLDIFSGWDAPEHLRQREFYELAQRALSDDGVLLVNVGDDPGLSFFASQAQHMLEVFEHVWCLCERSMLTGKQAGNLILVGSRHVLDESMRTFLEGVGPHPGVVLDTWQVADFVKSL
ncbi:spermidine synthase [Rothia sp. P7181]|uniref:spermidine synthase n=1 Tax=Rothia sp. P7181 TaxID=3402663 RepID=UPI003AE4AC55